MDTKSGTSSSTGTPASFGTRAKHTCYNLPWSAIVLVTIVITCHSLVLWGNLTTAKMFNDIGHSTVGWSDVGLSVSHSMIAEVEHLMAETTAGLTKALGTIITIEQDIHILFGHAGNTTKKAISSFQESQIAQLEGNKSAKMELSANAKQLPGTEILASGDVKRHTDGQALLEFEGVSAVEVTQRRMQDNATNDQVPSGFGKFEKYINNVPELKEKIHAEVEKRLKQLHHYVKEFWKLIKPALVQVGKWLHQMGTKMQGFIEQFSTIIDRVQKIMDQIMSKLDGSANIKQHLVYNTFNIFDIHHVGYITVRDIHDVAALYGVTAMAGPNGKKLLEKYDENHDGVLTQDEYARMVDDKSIPGAMVYVLRLFSKKLAQIAGQMKGAKMRDQVGEAVAEYFQLMVAKNLTKCSWVSQALTNGSVPVQFTADVLKQLVEQKRRPDKLTHLDVGQIITEFMVKMNVTFVEQAVKELENHTYWVDQGFSPASQPKIVHQVLIWVRHAKKILASGGKPGVGLLQDGAEVDLAALTKEYEKKHRRYANALREERVRDSRRVFHSEATHHLFKSLLGTHSGVGAPVVDADVKRVLSGGVPALPATLRFKTWLVYNATDTAQRFQNYSFDYAKTSSNPIDSFANQIQAMVKKIQSFLNLMMKYCTKRGIDQIGHKIIGFTEKSGSDINKITDRIVDEMLHPNGTAKNTALSQISVSGELGELSGVWKELTGILNTLKGIMPPVIGDIKFAHKEIGMVASTLKSIFAIFKVKGNPIFEMVSNLYRTIWTVYFSLFAALTLVILFYAFWAYGFFGGPDTTETEESGEGPPKALTCAERCSRCCNACLYCMRMTQDSHCCFWSCILLSEVVILLLFIISIVLAMISGIKAFINVGCMQIYLLGDNTTCTSIMHGIKNWMSTFWENEGDTLYTACNDKMLTTCKTITKDLMLSVIFTAGGSMAAAIFSFQMLFLSAQLHEKAVWTNKLKGLPNKKQID